MNCQSSLQSECLAKHVDFNFCKKGNPKYFFFHITGYDLFEYDVCIDTAELAICFIRRKYVRNACSFRCHNSKSNI